MHALDFPAIGGGKIQSGILALPREMQAQAGRRGAEMGGGEFRFRPPAQRSPAEAHHIGQYGVAMHVGGAADQFDVIHRRSRDALQKLFGAFLLAGGKLSVDQDIAHRAGETAQTAVAILQPEARQQPHHVERGGRLVGGKIAGGIAGGPVVAVLGESGGGKQKQQKDKAHGRVFAQAPLRQPGAARQANVSFTPSAPCQGEAPRLHWQPAATWHAMTKLLPFFLLVLVTALPQGVAGESRSSSSSSQTSSSSSSSRSTSTVTHSDQDEARDAVRKSKIMPLTAILEIVTKREPGTVMEVELETRDGKLIYRIEVLTDNGRRREIKLDARNGTVLWAGDD